MPERDALFLDFDGTLVDIAPTPDSVRPAPYLSDLLAALEQRLGGALALITGRAIEDLDRFLMPFQATAAGLHGRDRRLHDGQRIRAEVDPDLIAGARAQLKALAERWPGTLLEDKGESVALHYRNVPEAGEAALEAGRAVASGSGGRLRLIPGKMVVELVPAGFDKGTAIASLLEHPPFAGRNPIFIGDDVTDEAGFALVKRLGGIGIRIGATEATEAGYVLPDVAALHAWLRRGLEAGTRSPA